MKRGLVVIFAALALLLGGCNTADSESRASISDESGYPHESTSALLSGSSAWISDISIKSKPFSSDPMSAHTPPESSPNSDGSSLSTPVEEYIVQHSNNGAVIERYLGGGGKVIVPSVLEGRPVAEIWSSAFYKRADITEVTIPDSVIIIGEGAFRDCAALKKISLGNGIKKIDDSLFYGCAALSEVSIGRNAAEIGASAFYDCKRLERITLPVGVTLIGEEAFRGCSALRSVSLPNGLRRIGGNAFSGCTELKEITVPDSIVGIGNEAFNGCRSIQVTYKGDKYDYEHIYDLYAAIGGGS